MTLVPRAQPLLARASRSRRRVGLALLAITAVASAAAIVVGGGLAGSSRGASPAAASSRATTVQRRDLVATDTESGTLRYANPQTVYNRITGTVTWLPQVGDVIKPGQALYDVDNQRVVLFDGTTPAYRDLSSGISDGPDVKELNRDLVRMGFDPSKEITVDDAWQTGTTDAIDRWQSSVGEAQSGTITLGQVVFLPGAQRVTTVDAVLGSNGSSSPGAGQGSGAGSGSGSGSGSSKPSSNTAGTADPRPEFASLETTTPTTRMTKAASACNPASGKSRSRRSKSSSCGSSTQAALLALLKAETAELEKSLAANGRRAGSGAPGASAGGMSAGRGGASGSAGANAGGAGGSGLGGSGAGNNGSGATAQPILQTTSNRLDVVVDLDTTKQSEAVVGERVTVQMPNGSVVDEKITKVSPIAQSSSGSSGSGSAGGAGGSGGNSSSTASATIPVTIALAGRVRASGLDQAAVSVNFEKQKASNVLSVPVTALLATAGGGYAVQEALPPRRLIPVTPGLFAAGYVQISGAQVQSGLRVTNSQG